MTFFGWKGRKLGGGGREGGREWWWGGSWEEEGKDGMGREIPKVNFGTTVIFH